MLFVLALVVMLLTFLIMIWMSEVALTWIKSSIIVVVGFLVEYFALYYILDIYIRILRW